MYIRILKPGVLVTAIVILATILATACGSDEPGELEIPVKLEHDTLNPEIIKVKHNDMVTLNIESEEPAEFHLHGYDIEKEVGPDRKVDLFFEADITGRFKITMHRLEETEEHESEPGEDHSDEGGEREEIEIGFLEVRPR